MDTTTYIIIGAAVLLVLAVALVLSLGSGRVPMGNRTRLRKRFGGEYDHVLMTSGDTRSAERELSRRLDRRREVRVRRPTDAEKDRYREAWLAVQQRFVDDPAGALRGSRRLLTEVSVALGYPEDPSGIDDDSFEYRLADLSADHGDEVAAVHRTVRTDTDTTDTEHLREVLVAHRGLLESLLGGAAVRPAAHAVTPEVAR
ncbi:hypothetical protein ACOQFV_02880 [Nocardiopsis changdeensis]|uniref:Secreted protein n=1 Tax=Nocardiopsis changdeensis TaxID=2831969 RepID=A0ABX8BLF4_9ACTN|nr:MULTISPECIES: hypothetical protein [Nocardiopsis]QUX22570.1 hypothetical protein KGD84_30455 [Nocardiopsis changdeensis]QYX38511.1 hypothetical protein K1J57_07835 [Nocardiopsis sp. MT53]